MAEKDAKQKAKKGPAFDMMPEQQFLLRVTVCMLMDCAGAAR